MRDEALWKDPRWLDGDKGKAGCPPKNLDEGSSIPEQLSFLDVIPDKREDRPSRRGGYEPTKRLVSMVHLKLPRYQDIYILSYAVSAP